MRLIFVLAAFILFSIPGLTGTVHASPAKVYRLGFPKDHDAQPYKWLLAGLEQKGMVVGENLQVVSIDLNGYQDETGRERIRQEIAKRCDLFFAGGSFLEILFKVEPRSPLLFINVAGPERTVPVTMQANTTGVRVGSESGIYKQAMEMLPPGQRQKLGLICFKGSTIALMASGFQKTCEQLGVELVVREYATKGKIESVMRDFKAEGVGGVVLFPPAFRKGELQELIAWQNNLKLPIISLIRPHVVKGLFGGPTINSQAVKPGLADYAAKILQGRSPGQLPVKYFSPEYVLNLATASRLGIDVPAEVVNRADIVGLVSIAAPEETVTKSLVPGDFVLGLASDTGNNILKEVLIELGKRGYVQGKNLRLARFDLDFDGDPRKQRLFAKHLAAETDVIFATGNVLSAFIQLSDLKTPVCFISTKETAAIIPPGRKHNFTGVIRASFGSVIEVAQQIVPGAKRLTMLGRAGSKLPKAIKRYQRVAEGYGVTIDFRLFADKAEIGPLMHELRENSDAMLLFSPGMNLEEVGEIVNWQNRLGFPVLGHFERDVRAGLLAGMVVDTETVPPKLAEYIDKLLQGRSAAQLPDYYYPGEIIINLRAANKLQWDFPAEIISRAEIIR